MAPVLNGVSLHRTVLGWTGTEAATRRGRHSVDGGKSDGGGVKWMKLLLWLPNLRVCVHGPPS